MDPSILPTQLLARLINEEKLGELLNTTVNACVADVNPKTDDMMTSEALDNCDVVKNFSRNGAYVGGARIYLMSFGPGLVFVYINWPVMDVIYILQDAGLAISLT